ncbi:Chromosome III, complete sequence, related [Eimeria maxima]|uniref:Chromosome III, complete sequence, related n=1 Tax=Eimeria maxima TaxID=5804 RepID=U6MCU7_EIMMA|nr:Chromosome III, complete sequence, related [Eimeria maxima]CDJ61856.1 Chromosome III, complete sequence, related [Eimeria maxima]
MWKSLFLVAISGAQVSRVSSKAIADGYTQMGQPFRFSKSFVAAAPAFEESSSEAWWPATGKPPLRKAQRTHLDETFDVALHTETSFPSPFEQPEKCVAFSSLSHSWVCDPDHLLSPEEQAFVEARLLKLRDTAQSTCNDSQNYYQAAVAVASDIAVNADETPQQATDRFAEALLRRWGVGNKGCHDGIVLAFVKNLKTVSLATRENVDTRVASALFKTHIQRSMNHVFLSTGSPAAAVATGVELVNRHLPRAPIGLSWSATILLTLGGVYLASVLGIYYSLNTFMMKSYTVEQ